MNGVLRFTQAYSQAPWRKQLQILGLFLLGVVLVTLIAGIYLNVTARAGTIGREILNMRERMEELTLINANLETQLAMLWSSANMEQRAEALGFIPIDGEQITYVVVPGYIPRRQAVIAPPPEPVVSVAASLPPDYTESLFDWLGQNVLPAFVRFIEEQP